MSSILNQKWSVLIAMQISRQLNVNVPTIKAIQRVFRREGRIARKSKRDKFHVLRSNYAIILTGDS